MYQFVIAGLGIDKRSDYPVVLLHNKDKDLILPIWIGPLEAQSIAIALQDEEMERPLTHDLMVNAISGLGSVIEQVEIHTVKEKTFYADIVLRQANAEQIFLDARPSDCIALAIRVNAPIMVSEQVMESAALPAIIHYEENQTQEIKLDNKEEFLDFLDSVKASDFKLPDDPQSEPS